MEGVTSDTSAIARKVEAFACGAAAVTSGVVAMVCRREAVTSDREVVAFYAAITVLAVGAVA
ncbi:hypothetical protein [Parapedobacter sp. 2B3]|uniref:hypothetical protein n=1 Tax=Parapedobacter sp. 2B3 TaxID=3342381 RepID=UPI0035B62B64